MTNNDLLIQSLTYDNWFTQLLILADSYQESGNERGELVCRLLVKYGKRPKEIIAESVYGFKPQISYQWNLSWFPTDMQVYSDTISWDRMHGVGKYVVDSISEAFIFATQCIPDSDLLSVK